MQTRKLDRLIFVECLIELQASRDAIYAHYSKLCVQQTNRFLDSRQKLIDALWHGFFALHTECKQHAERVRERGQLLFAWEATTVLQREVA